MSRSSIVRASLGSKREKTSKGGSWCVTAWCRLETSRYTADLVLLLRRRLAVSFYNPSFPTSHCRKNVFIALGSTLAVKDDPLIAYCSTIVTLLSEE